MTIKSHAWLLAAAAIAASLFATSACSDPASGDSGGGDNQSVSIVGFSILKTANKQLVADFQKTDAGKGVTFKTSYGASGDQSRAVIAGLKADEVHLSLEPDVTKLVDEKLVADDWKSATSCLLAVFRMEKPTMLTSSDLLLPPPAVAHPVRATTPATTPTSGRTAAVFHVIDMCLDFLRDRGGSTRVTDY